MASNAQEEKPLFSITYTAEELRENLSLTDYHELIYILLDFGKYIFLSENDIYIRITPFEDNSGYVELVIKQSDEIKEWRYIEKLSYYMSVPC